MAPRLPSAWTVATIAGILGGCIGGGTAALATLAKPMRIGDFSGAGSEADGRKVAVGPRAAVDSTEHDFGTMAGGQSASRSFRISNTGDAPLTLSKGRSSCGCTVAAIEKESIPPGGSSDVSVEWKTKGDGGLFQQDVTIHTSDHRRPDITLRIAGTVVPTWRAMPSTIVFPKLTSGQAETATAVLLTYARPPTTLVGLDIVEPATAEFFSLDSRPLTAEELAATGDAEATSGVAISVATRPGLPQGSLRQTVRARLMPAAAGSGSSAASEAGDRKADGEGSAGDPAGSPSGTATAAAPPPPKEIIVEIPVEGQVGGDLAVAGRAWDSEKQVVSLGTVPSRTGLRTDLFMTVKGPHREAVRPQVKEVLPKSLVVDIGEARPVGVGTVWRVPITLSIPPGSPTCNHLGNQQGPLGRIVLDTGHPDSPLLELPVRVSIGP